MLELIWKEKEGCYYIPKYKIKAPAACLGLFPQFIKDFETLWKNKIITVDKKKLKLIWNWSLISLAQYFYYQKYKCTFFWSIVEMDFNIKKGKLKQAIYMNKKQDRSKDSRDYAKIKKLLKSN